LKKSTLDRLKVMVTLTLASLKASSSGGGKKSLTTRSLPSGSSVYLILFFIYRPAFTPVSGSDDPYMAMPSNKTHGQNPSPHPPEAIKPGLMLAMPQVLGDDALGIAECMLGGREGHPMLGLVLAVLAFIPFKTHPNLP
jgi:hypothetical protein